MKLNMYTFSVMNRRKCLCWELVIDIILKCSTVNPVIEKGQGRPLADTLIKQITISISNE